MNIVLKKIHQNRSDKTLPQFQWFDNDVEPRKITTVQISDSK